MKIALIGHSGSGKTTTAKMWGGEPEDYDMDRRLDTNTVWSAEELRACILKTPSPVIAVSVHRDALREIARLKTEQDRTILYFYLQISPTALQERLIAKGDRNEQVIQSILNEYQTMDVIFRAIADHVLDASAMNPKALELKIQALSGKSS